jgi:hypothetical protein
VNGNSMDSTADAGGIVCVQYTLWLPYLIYTPHVSRFPLPGAMRQADGRSTHLLRAVWSTLRSRRLACPVPERGVCFCIDHCSPHDAQSSNGGLLLSLATCSCVGLSFPTCSALSLHTPDPLFVPSVPLPLPPSQCFAHARQSPLKHPSVHNRNGSLRSKWQHRETRCARPSEPPPNPPIRAYLRGPSHLPLASREKSCRTCTHTPWTAIILPIRASDHSTAIITRRPTRHTHRHSTCPPLNHRRKYLSRIPFHEVAIRSYQDHMGEKAV